MHELIAFMKAHEIAISTGVILTLKWIYNAWPPEGTTFPKFLRTFIGEIVQEAPQARGGLGAQATPIPVTIAKVPSPQ